MRWISFDLAVRGNGELVCWLGGKARSGCIPITCHCIPLSPKCLTLVKSLYPRSRLIPGHLFLVKRLSCYLNPPTSTALRHRSKTRKLLPNRSAHQSSKHTSSLHVFCECRSFGYIAYADGTYTHDCLEPASKQPSSTCTHLQAFLEWNYPPSVDWAVLILWPWTSMYRNVKRINCLQIFRSQPWAIRSYFTQRDGNFSGH